MRACVLRSIVRMGHSEFATVRMERVSQGGGDSKKQRIIGESHGSKTPNR